MYANSHNSYETQGKKQYMNQWGKNENAVVSVLRVFHKYGLDLFTYIKSTIDLCYGILAGVQSKYFIVLPIRDYNQVFGLYCQIDWSPANIS